MARPAQSSPARVRRAAAAARVEAEVLAEVYRFAPVVTVLQDAAEPEKEPAGETGELGWPMPSEPTAEELNE